MFTIFELSKRCERMNKKILKSTMISCVCLLAFVLFSCEYYKSGSDQLTSQLSITLNQFFESEVPLHSYQRSITSLNEDGAELVESFCISDASISYYKNNGDHEYYIQGKTLYRKTNSTDEKIKTVFDESSLSAPDVSGAISFIKSILKDDFIERRSTEVFSRDPIPYQSITIEFKVADINRENLAKKSYENIYLVARYDMDNKIESVSIDFCEEDEIVSYSFSDEECTIDYPSDLSSYIDSEYEFTIE